MNDIGPRICMRRLVSTLQHTIHYIALLEGWPSLFALASSALLTLDVMCILAIVLLLEAE